MIDKRILALGLVLASVATASYLYGVKTYQQEKAEIKIMREAFTEAHIITTKLNDVGGDANAAALALPSAQQLQSLQNNLAKGHRLNPKRYPVAVSTNLKKAVKKSLKDITTNLAGVANKEALLAKARGLTAVSDVAKAAKNLVTAINTALGGGGGDGDGDGGDGGIDPKIALRDQIQEAWNHGVDGVLVKYEALTTKVGTIPATKKKTAKYNDLVSKDPGSTFANLNKNSDAELAGLNQAKLETRLAAINNYLTELNQALQDANNGFAVDHGYFETKAPGGGGGDADAAEKATRRAEIKALWNDEPTIEQLVLDIKGKNTEADAAGKKATDANLNLVDKKAGSTYKDLKKTDAELDVMTLDELNTLHTNVAGYKANLQQALADADAGFATANGYFAVKPPAGGGGGAGGVVTEAEQNALNEIKLMAGVNELSPFKKTILNKKIADLEETDVYNRNDCKNFALANKGALKIIPYRKKLGAELKNLITDNAILSEELKTKIIGLMKKDTILPTT